MSTKRVHIRSAVNASAVSKDGGRYTIRGVCGAVDDIVSRATATGMFWSVAAGNWAQQHWAGTFTDRNGNSVHEFAPGVEELGRTYQAGDLIRVSPFEPVPVDSVVERGEGECAV